MFAVYEGGARKAMLKSMDPPKPTLSTDIAALIEQRIHALSISELVDFARLAADDDVIGVEEAASLLKVHPITLRKKAVAWGVPHRRLGTEWRFSRTRLLEWMREAA